MTRGGAGFQCGEGWAPCRSFSISPERRKNSSSGTPSRYKTTASPSSTSLLEPSLTEQHLAAVDEKSLYQRVRREHVGQHCADQHGVREDHGHRHEPVLFHSCGKQAAEQRPGCADDDIECGHGRKNVGDQAAERQADGQTRLQHDEHAQAIRDAELDISVGERGGQDRDGCVESGDDAVQRDLAGGEFFHGLSSFCKPRRLEG